MLERREKALAKIHLGRPILIDVDLDFLFAPGEREDRSGPEDMPSTLSALWLQPEDFLAGLRQAGFVWSGRSTASPPRPPHVPAICGPDHALSYHAWALARLREATVFHFDAHSDCYPSLPEIVHCGNYLMHAWHSGVVRRVFWIVPDWFSRFPHHPAAEDAVRFSCSPPRPGCRAIPADGDPGRQAAASSRQTGQGSAGLVLEMCPWAHLGSLMRSLLPGPTPALIPTMITLASSPQFVRSFQAETAFEVLKEAFSARDAKSLLLGPALGDRTQPNQLKQA